MNELWGHMTGALIVLMMFTFISIWIWAWSGHHKRVFHRMAELPMEDDLPSDHPHDPPSEGQP